MYARVCVGIGWWAIPSPPPFPHPHVRVLCMYTHARTSPAPCIFHFHLPHLTISTPALSLLHSPLPLPAFLSRDGAAEAPEQAPEQHLFRRCEARNLKLGGSEDGHTKAESSRSESFQGSVTHPSPPAPLPGVTAATQRVNQVPCSPPFLHSRDTADSAPKKMFLANYLFQASGCDGTRSSHRDTHAPYSRANVTWKISFSAGMDVCNAYI